jgi:ABC-type multidrug transport system ATPase subunit
VRQLIKGLANTCTVVVSSHNLQELEEVCSAAAIMDRGRLVVAGTMAELTAAAREVQFQLAEGPVPFEPVRALGCVTSVDFNPTTRTLMVMFDSARYDAESVIGAVLRVLLDHGARISGVSKGRSLEQRVIELT